jgi:coenzyme F420-0:L-glutamate ligase/coenzyme F420-1:gamma-L-glutamate ligase
MTDGSDDAAPGLVVVPVTGVPEVHEGDDVALLVHLALTARGDALQEGDVVVVSSKVVSKALGLWADATDPEAVVATQSERVVAERVVPERVVPERTATGRTGGRRVTRIVKAAAGPVMAAAGVDGSNTGGRDGLLLLPRDPDGQAAALRARLQSLTGLQRVGVVVSDTAGRPWRVGQTDFALGAAGLVVVDDLRGGVDADGRPLAVTVRAVADELAAAGDLVKGKVGVVPAAVVRGTPWATAGDGAGAAALVRAGREDWFDYGRAEAVRAALGVEPGSAAAERLGVASVAPEPVGVRVGRAVGVACHDLPFACGAHPTSDGTIEVTAVTAYGVGVVAARVQVALWGEGLLAQLAGEADVGPDGEARATLTVTER